MIHISERDDRFYVAESKIPGAGYGCFAKVPLHKFDKMEIIGVLVKSGSVCDHCTHYANRYKFRGSPKGGDKIVPMGYAAMVNHTSDKNMQNMELVFLQSPRNNENAGQVFYQALRDIEANEELVGNYGEVFNKTVEMEKAAHNEDWKKFLSYDLYNLNEVVAKLQ